MTFTITKVKLAIATLVVALLAPATAFATHSWSDVPSGAFYHDAVAWAKANGMTVGCDGGTAFCPDRTVTRGENITFAKRYDDLVVQPALTTITGTAAANSAAIVGNDTDIANRYTKAEVDAAVLAALLGTATIPSGTTVTGYDNWDFGAIDDNEDILFTIQLPGRAPVALADTDVNFVPSGLATDGDATCTGTVDVPTAPAGKVCIYNGQSGAVDGLFGRGASQDNFDNQAFRVSMTVNTGTQGADVFINVTWAYTAP